MLEIIIIGLATLAAALVTNIVLIIQGFKVSKTIGGLAIFAPLLLALGMGLLSYFAYETALMSCGEEEHTAQGQQEVESNIDDLENAKPSDFDLDL